MPEQQRAELEAELENIEETVRVDRVSDLVRYVNKTNGRFGKHGDKGELTGLRLAEYRELFHQEPMAISIVDGSYPDTRPEGSMSASIQPDMFGAPVQAQMLGEYQGQGERPPLTDADALKRARPLPGQLPLPLVNGEEREAC